MDGDVVEGRQFCLIGSLEDPPVGLQRLIGDRDGRGVGRLVAATDPGPEIIEGEIEEVQFCASVQRASRCELLGSLGPSPQPVLQDHVDVAREQLNCETVEPPLESVMEGLVGMRNLEVRLPIVSADADATTIAFKLLRQGRLA